MGPWHAGSDLGSGELNQQLVSLSKSELSVIRLEIGTLRQGVSFEGPYSTLAEGSLASLAELQQLG